MQPIATKYEFKLPPYEHQNIALKKSWNKEEFALFCEMGTGKSKMLIDNIGILFERDEITAALIVAPKGVYKNWQRSELPRHMPDRILEKTDVIAWSPDGSKKTQNELSTSLKKDGRYSRSYFSGYYKVLTVNNDFKGGKFTQTLDLVRYANQSNSGEARTGWDNQTTDSNRTGDTTLNNKSQNPATSGYNLQKPVNLVGPLQTSAPLKVQDGDGLVIKMPIEYINNPKALTNQVPATNTSLADITQKGPTVPIGPNANAEGEAIVLAGAPG